MQCILVQCVYYTVYCSGLSLLPSLTQARTAMCTSSTTSYSTNCHFCSYWVGSWGIILNPKSHVIFIFAFLLFQFHFPIESHRIIIYHIAQSVILGKMGLLNKESYTISDYFHCFNGQYQQCKKRVSLNQPVQIDIRPNAA